VIVPVFEGILVSLLKYISPGIALTPFKVTSVILEGLGISNVSFNVEAEYVVPLKTTIEFALKRTP
jgi:hypothetical protein